MSFDKLLGELSVSEDVSKENGKVMDKGIGIPRGVWLRRVRRALKLQALNPSDATPVPIR